MKNKKKKLTITIDAKVNDEMENYKVNKSKLVNFLIKHFFDNEKDIEKYNKILQD